MSWLSFHGGRFFSLIYPHFSNFSSKMGKVKENKSTPHFGSLPQGERRERRKDFKKTPHPDPLPQSEAVS
jgi:hypothetical protein